MPIQDYSTRTIDQLLMVSARIQYDAEDRCKWLDRNSHREAFAHSGCCPRPKVREHSLSANTGFLATPSLGMDRLIGVINEAVSPVKNL